MEDRRRKKIQGLFCEALREAGVLTVVFSSLDAAFNRVQTSWFFLAGWALLGSLLLVAGIYLDPETRK